MKRLLQNTLLTVLIASCALGVSMRQAQAQNDTIRNSDNAVWIAAGADSLGYKEPSPGTYQLGDSERDWITSLAAGASYMGGSQDLYLALEGAISFGNAHYNGAYSSSPTIPLESTTKETISGIDGRIGKGFSVYNNVMLVPYAELGFRYWNRSLSADQVEDYQNFDALGGLMLQVAPTDRLILSLYGSGGSTFSAQMRTSGETYHLGSDGMAKLGGKIGYDITDRLELFTTADYEHFSYGQSSVIADGTYEPNSHTNETMLRVGVAYHF